MKRFGIWLEVTVLVIPEINDDPTEPQDAARCGASVAGVGTAGVSRG
jgi:pyruvate-formate lyase-activating enzyme